MKNNTLKKATALVLAGIMVCSLAACGDTSSASVSGSTSTPTSTVASASTSQTAEPTQAPEVKKEPFKLSVIVPTSDATHEEANEQYDELTSRINEYTNCDVTWEFMDTNTYYEQVATMILANEFRDIMVVGFDATFQTAAEQGYFWDLTDYLDDYDNLATIPEATRKSCSTNGHIYGLPRSRTLARNGFGYRADWCDALGLSAPTTWDEFHDMLYAFTYNDPDGNGKDDTVGLFIDGWTGVWNIPNMWFGVPNNWGIDANGDLIKDCMTPEWRTALAAYRTLYSEGLINQNFLEVGAGKARNEGLRTSIGGAGFQVLDDLRKVETYFESEEGGLIADVEDDPVFTLGGYLDCGKGTHVLPTTGFNNMVAISKKNIKTEEQLRAALAFLNDLNDGEMLNLIDYGLEGISWFVNDEGYIERYTDENRPVEIATTLYNTGLNQVLAYYTAEENARPVIIAPATTPITILENELYEANIEYCVPDYGAGYTSATYVELGADLNSMISTAISDYVTGVIDDAGLDEVLETWRLAGGDTVTAEMNAAYHAAGN